MEINGNHWGHCSLATLELVYVNGVTEKDQWTSLRLSGSSSRGSLRAWELLASSGRYWEEVIGNWGMWDKRVREREVIGILWENG